MKRLLVMTTAALLVWAGVTTAQPGPRGDGDCFMGRQRAERRAHRMHPGGPGMRGEGRMDRGGLMGFMGLADRLDLTEEQRARLRDMSIEFRTERIDREADLKKARLRLTDLRTEQNAPEAEVEQAIDELARLRADMEKMQYRHRQAMRSVLTDQQRERLEQFRQDRRGRFWDDGDDDEDEDSDDQTIPPYRPRRGRI